MVRRTLVRRTVRHSPLADSIDGRKCCAILPITSRTALAVRLSPMEAKLVAESWRLKIRRSETCGGFSGA
jgi:hypothetical protein